MKNIDKEKILFCLLIAFSVLRLDKVSFQKCNLAQLHCSRELSVSKQPRTIMSFQKCMYTYVRCLRKEHFLSSF